MSDQQIIERNGEEVPTPDPDLTAADYWVLGTAPQLRRQWSGTCLTCAHWTAPAGKGLGTCAEIGDSDIIDLGRKPTVATAHNFGCRLWSEIPEGDPIVERAGYALEAAHMDAMPESWEPPVGMLRNLEIAKQRQAERAKERG